MVAQQNEPFDASRYLRPEELPLFEALIDTIVRDGGNTARAYATFPELVGLFTPRFIEKALIAREARFKEMTEQLIARERGMKESRERGELARKDSRGRFPR